VLRYSDGSTYEEPSQLPKLLGMTSITLSHLYKISWSPRTTQLENLYGFLGLNITFSDRKLLYYTMCFEILQNIIFRTTQLEDLYGFLGPNITFSDHKLLYYTKYFGINYHKLRILFYIFCLMF